MGKIPKPQLHGLSVRRAKLWILSSLINGVLGALAFQLFYINPKKKLFRDFYENYVIEKEFETMMNKGLFDSC
ncbi:cytochrome c oxidase subunit 6C-2-like [Rhynchophorus ferrugineus]|uniref:cytochrome c oxidase subunit 6C-2-like n=1 Tax=Rhynchophorus ferrugineus TaxID=354439 RepID=UPI003FCC99B7